jgi:hypothetical protein
MISVEMRYSTPEESLFTCQGWGISSRHSILSVDSGLLKSASIFFIMMGSSELSNANNGNIAARMIKVGKKQLDFINIFSFFNICKI